MHYDRGHSLILWEEQRSRCPRIKRVVIYGTKRETKWEGHGPKRQKRRVEYKKKKQKMRENWNKKNRRRKDR
jgi:hypothetical protein